MSACENGQCFDGSSRILGMATTEAHFERPNKQALGSRLNHPARVTRPATCDAAPELILTGRGRCTTRQLGATKMAETTTVAESRIEATHRLRRRPLDGSITFQR